MRANNLVELVKHNEPNIKSIRGYENRILYIEDLCQRTGLQTQLQRIRKAASESLESAMNFVLEEKESDIVLTALKLNQDENSFCYKERGFNTDMLTECRCAVKFIREICLDD